jgi:hypothetical protein
MNKTAWTFVAGSHWEPLFDRFTLKVLKFVGTDKIFMRIFGNRVVDGSPSDAAVALAAGTAR